MSASPPPCPPRPANSSTLKTNSSRSCNLTDFSIAHLQAMGVAFRICIKEILKQDRLEKEMEKGYCTQIHGAASFLI